MKTEQVKLSQVKINSDNPRTITKEKFNKLINSILVFPKMLELRPIVVDNKMSALGGNMRTEALRAISKMSVEEIAQRLHGIADFVEKSEGERKVLVDYWEKWLDNPIAFIIKASELSASERRQFMIKDNASFGQWDFDALANKWDNKRLDDWGVDVWNANPTAFTPMGATPSPAQPTPAMPDASEEDNPADAFQDALPPELQGVDISPDVLPKIEGSDETAMERVIIVYPKERLQELAQLLGMPSIDKVVYRLEEIIPSIEGAE
jgi:hypothetical protein